MISLLIATLLAAANPTPQAPMRTTGDIHINLEQGRLEGAVCIENWPAAASNAISLHGGLNLAHVRDGQAKPVEFNGWYGASADGEGRLYDINRPTTGPVCFDYVGAFPVFRDLDAAQDFKGMIAFDGKSLRASEQAVWLPTPYNSKAKSREQVTAYRLHVRCDDCTMIYMNGSPPVAGSDATFESQSPREPLLFAAQGHFDKGAAMTFVNAQPKLASSTAVNKLFSDLRAYYAGYLGVSFDDTPVVLTFTSLERTYNPKHRWGFATWPTLAFGNGDIDEMADSIGRGDKDGRGDIAYLAHETAHYYFGTLLKPTGPYRWLLVESTAEFMSIKALGALQGQAAVAEKLAPMIAKFDKRASQPMPLDKVSAANQIGDNYRYNYAPLLLLTLEKTVGEKRMQGFMRGLLQSPEPQTWTDLSAIAFKAGISDAEWRDWTDRCVENIDGACIDSLKPAQT